jgi:hypothetical protein
VRAKLVLDILGEPRTPVHHREQDAGDAEARIEASLDEVDRAEQLREPFEGVVLSLHGDDHPVGGGKRVHRERAERRRAVEEDEVVGRGCLLSERVGEVALAVHERGQMHRRGGKLGLRRHEVEVRDRAGGDKLAERGRPEVEVE